MSIDHYDLIIAGAGPAGLTAALSLADSGLRIALVEKSRFPREKICGDALSGTVLNVLRRLPGNLYDDFLKLGCITPSRGIRFYAPDRKFVDVPFLMPETMKGNAAGFLCKRIHFDDFLMGRVRQIPGITVLEGFKITDAGIDGAEVKLTGENGAVYARMVLGTEGANSIIGSALAGNRPDHDHQSLGVRAYFEGISGLHPDNFIELHFLRELLPGYLWIFPMQGGEANVGLGMSYKQVKSGKLNLSALMTGLINRTPGLESRFRNARMTGRIEGYSLPLGPSNRVISGNRFLLAGDAASLVDPFSGEGIGNAMVSGELAAKAIKEAFLQDDFSGEFLGFFDEMIRNRFGRDLRISHLIQRMAGSAFLFNLVVGKAAANENLRMLLSKMYTDQDIKEELTSPVFYAKLLFR